MAAPQELGAVLARLERRRIAVLAWRRSGAVVIAALAAGVAGFGANPLVRMAAPLLGVLGALVFWRYLNSRITAEFRQELMPVLLSASDPSLRYRLAGRVAQSEFEASGLFMRPDRYAGQDLVQGYMGNTALEFSLVHAQQRCTRNYSDMYGNIHTQVYYQTLFRGLFLSADFNKHFSGRVMLSPRAAGFLRKLSASHVMLEDPEFNRLFTVTATDQVEARYVISPTLIERLKALRAKLGPFQAAFAKGQLFLAFNMPADAFALSLSRSLTAGGQVDKLRANLATVTGIVDALGLNIRIWSKAGRHKSDSVPAGARLN